MTDRRLRLLKRILLIAATVFVLVPQAFAAPWLKSLPAAQKKAKEDNQLIFVDMFADWCGWCHQLEQQVFPSETFQKATDNHVLLRLNTEDGSDGTRLARMFQISSLPTSVVLTHDMVVVGLIRGFLPADRMATAISDVETKYAEFKKRTRNEDSIANDFQKRLDLAVEYRTRFAFADSASRLRKLVAQPKVPQAIRDQAYYELALTQFYDHKLDDSMKTIRQFATIQTKGDNYEKSRVLASEIYVQQGNFLGAVNELKNFKTKFPNSPLIANVDMILPQLEARLAAGRLQ